MCLLIKTGVFNPCVLVVGRKLVPWAMETRMTARDGDSSAGCQTVDLTHPLLSTGPHND
jgi:hypothetical protein